MHNFNKIKNTLIFLAIFVILNYFLSYFLIPKGPMQKSFYKFRNEKNIDFLCIGDSMDAWSLNQNILREKVSKNAYIVSVNGGNLETSYMFLLEAVRRFNLKNVIIGWDIIQNFENPGYKYKEQAEFYNHMVSEAAKNSKLRRILLPQLLKQTFTETIFKCCIYRENLNKIPEVLKTKTIDLSSPFERNYDDDGKILTPIDINDLDKYGYKRIVETTEYSSKIRESDINYIKAIKKICSENNIGLSFLLVPLPDCVIKGIPVVNDMISVSEGFFKQEGVKLINGFDQDIFSNSTNNLNFKDCFGHMIEPYRSEFTQYFTEYIKKMI